MNTKIATPPVDSKPSGLHTWDSRRDRITVDTPVVIPDGIEIPGDAL